MKRTLLLVAIPWVFGATPLLAKSELETLRSLCAEQERQIRQLEDENAKLRSMASLTASRSSDKASLTGPPAPAAGGTSARTNTYTVRPNDSIERVSRKFGITPAALAGMNGLKVTSMVREGQKLKVPGSPAAPTAMASPAAAATTDAAPQAAGAVAASGKTHQLKDGETFFSIGRKYGIPTATLIAANPDIKPSAMRPGQVIRLSMPAPAAAPEPATAATAEKPSAEKPSSDPPATSRKPAAAEKPAAEKPAAEKASARVVATSKTLPEPEKKTASLSAGTRPVSSQATAATVPAPAPKKTGTPAPATATPAAKSSIRSVTIDGTTTYGEFATKHGTNIGRLNDLNALDLIETTVLAKGSELYVPAMP